MKLIVFGLSVSSSTHSIVALSYTGDPARTELQRVLGGVLYPPDSLDTKHLFPPGAAGRARELLRLRATELERDATFR